MTFSTLSYSSTVKQAFKAGYISKGSLKATLVKNVRFTQRLRPFPEQNSNGAPNVVEASLVVQQYLTSHFFQK